MYLLVRVHVTMPETGGGESHNRLPQLRNPNQDAGSTEGNLPVAALFGKLSETPSGEDPAYWPINVLNPTFKGCLQLIDILGQFLGLRADVSEEFLEKSNTCEATP